MDSDPSSISNSDNEFDEIRQDNRESKFRERGVGKGTVCRLRKCSESTKPLQPPEAKHSSKICRHSICFVSNLSFCEHNPMSMSQSRLTLGHRHLMLMSLCGIGPRRVAACNF
uniref:Uncharacterized protein n=1 Tax=Meloidogyne javanica TaxID=6303 RepID=A0A915LMH9_MELJA